MLRVLRTIAKKNIFLRKLVGYHLASSGCFDQYFKTYKLNPHWEQRINDVVSCPDNVHINRCERAGEIKKGIQYMHNGLKIYLGSYYGPEYARLLMESRGVHEPQEEKVFAAVLPYIPPNAVMLELGAFWSFYSMWFNTAVKGAKNFMIEPDAFNLGQGKRNFQLNGLQGQFIQAFIDNKSSRNGAVPTICIDDFVKQHSLDFIHILHSDIQGYEYEMLKGAANTIESNKIGYVFISTHSNGVHAQCVDFLTRRSFVILAEANLDKTFSEDGLIVAKAPFLQMPERIEIALKS